MCQRKWLLFKKNIFFQKCNFTIKTCLDLKTAAKDFWTYTKKKYCLLVFDAFRAHLQDDVLDALRKGNVQTAVIPAHCTSKVQPVDVSFNKPFKAILKHKSEEYIQECTEVAVHVKISSPSRTTLVKWVVEGNKYLESQEEVITKAFKVCGISSALDGSENHLIHCAKELPTMILPYGTDGSEDEDPFDSEDSNDTDSEEDPSEVDSETD